VQEFLGSCIFLFIKHPYDVGDRVLIDDTHLIVEHISLLYTSFKRVDNNRVVQLSNIKNNESWIENVTRSKAMKEQVSVVVHADTSFADIEVMRGELEAYVLSPENKRDFFPEVEIQIMEVKDLKSIELLIGMQHKVRSTYTTYTSLLLISLQSNWANEVLRQTRRNKLMTAVMSSVRTVPIYPAGADKPLSILRPTAEVVEAAREGVAADKDAVKILRDEITIAEEAEILGVASSSGIEIAGTQSQHRASIDSRRSFDARRPALGLRRAKD
jgi:hypothetical protein